MGSARIRYPAWDAVVLAVVYTALFALQFLQAPDGLGHWEELHTPTAAALLVSGHSWTRIVSLQYMPFCGGCTIETVAILPTTALFGPSLAIWKAVPLGFGLAILGIAMAIARRIGGNGAARIAGLCFVFAPTFYAQNRMIAWGNHFEVAAVILGQVWLWMRWLDCGGRWRAARFGMLSGIGFWFCYSSGFVAPVLALLWLRAVDRGLWWSEGRWFLGGSAAGLLPWAWTQLVFRGTGVTPDEPLLAIYGQGPIEMVSALHEVPLRTSSVFGPVFWRSSFGDALGTDGWVGGALVAAVGAVVSVEMIRRLWRWIRRPAKSDGLGPAIGALIGVYTLLYVGLSPIKDAISDGMLLPDELRYLNPLIPLWVIGIGGLAASRWMRAQRRIAAGVVAAWVVPGIVAAVAHIDLAAVSTRPLHLTALRTVGMSGRGAGLIAGPLDIEAAVQDIHGPPGVRRIGKFLLGEALAQRMAHGDLAPAALDEVLTGLSVADQQDLLEGVAHGIRGEAGWSSERPMAGPAPRLTAALREMSPEMGQILAAELIRFQQPNVMQMIEVLDHGWDPMAKVPWASEHPAYAAALAREAGRALAWRSMDLATGVWHPVRIAGERALGTDRTGRRGVMIGVGEVFGGQFGHEGAHDPPLSSALPPGLRAPFSEGFVIGARRTYWAIGSPQR